MHNLLFHISIDTTLGCIQSFCFISSHFLSEFVGCLHALLKSGFILINAKNIVRSLSDERILQNKHSI